MNKWPRRRDYYLRTVVRKLKVHNVVRGEVPTGIKSKTKFWLSPIEMSKNQEVAKLAITMPR